jgi:hypothetical protein
MARHPRYKARHAPAQQGGHAEPSVYRENFVRLQGRSRLREGPALQIGFAWVARFGPEEQPDQW